MNNKLIIKTQIAEMTAKDKPLFLQQVLKDYYQLRVEQSWQGGHILKGKAPEPGAIQLQNNDYLNLSAHPDIIKAMQQALADHGTGQMQSVVFHSENTDLVTSEQAYSEWLGGEACLITQSGWCANIGVIQALAKPGLPVYIDFYAHMSLWEGARSARAKPIPFAHNNIDSLQKRINRFGPGIIAVDSIYSTHGTISPLADYVSIAQDNQCLLIVDESHALGVRGSLGRGVAQEQGLSQHIDIISASLSKAMAGRGGLICGQQQLIELIRYNASPVIFSTALMPHDLRGFTQALSVIKNEPWRQKKLQENKDYMLDQLKDIGVNTLGSKTQIIPLLCGSEKNTIWLRQQLESAGIFGAVFCYPATPKNKALIRLSLTTRHTQQQIDHICDFLAKLKRNAPHLPLFQYKDSPD